MPDNPKNTRIVKVAWTVPIQGTQETIPAGEEVEIWRGPGTSLRVYWTGFQKKQLGFAAPVTEGEVTAHT